MKVIKDQKLINEGLNKIQETYGCGKKGTHKKICEICGESFDEYNDLDILIKTGPAKCPKCQPIFDLQDLIANYDRSQANKEWDNEVHKRNFKKDEKKVYDNLNVYSLDDYTETWNINRSNKLTALYEEIVKYRFDLIQSVGPQLTILDSIFTKKHNFWNEGGNLGYWSFVSAFNMIVIKLEECLNRRAKISIYKIQNKLQNEYKKSFENMKIVKTIKFKESGDSFSYEYDKFPIVEYVNKIECTINKYLTLVKNLKLLRDKLCAHSEPNFEIKEIIHLSDLKRIFVLIKLIYDGYIYAIAPDKFTNLRVEFNINLDWLDELCNRGIKAFKKETEFNRKMALKD